MRRYYNTRSYLLFFFFAVLFIVSCNNDKDDKKANDKPVADTTAAATNTQAQEPKAALISGTLDVLSTKGETFEKLPAGKLVFSFTFTQADKLTIHGWRDKIVGGIDPKVPVIKLDNGKPSGINYGPDMYFGNIILENDDINKIQRLIKKNNSLYVYFIPEITEVRHIKYKIFIGDVDPLKLIKVNAIDTGTEANPSPPKNY